MESGAIPDRLSAWTLDLPLRRAFVSAAAGHRTRRIVVVRIESGGIAGWGEAAPVPGHTADTAEVVWDHIKGLSTASLLALTPTNLGLAGAAIAQARADLAAQGAGLPLWRHLGGTSDVWASVAIGIDEYGQPDLGSLAAAAHKGYRRAKLKITPETTPATLAKARDLLPGSGLGLDANGSLSPADHSLLIAIDSMEFEYLEQPGPAGETAWHRRLRADLDTPISLDESAASVAAIETILETGAADIINLKVGRFGTRETLTLARHIIAAGAAVRLGGLLESGIGRAHSVALATCAEFSVPGDIAASDSYFEDDLVDPSWRITAGRLTPSDSAGIGVVVDEDAIARFATARFDSK